MNSIPYGKQSITEEDIRAVEEVLRSDYLTQGPKLREFEEAFAKYVGSRYAVGVANGTAALHLSAMALNVKPGDKVITTPITFAATANCVLYCGGEVIFCDIDRDTYLLDIEKVRETLEQRKDENIVGLIPADFAGLSVDMEAFRELADEYGLWLLEDSCHAPGAYFTDSKGQKQHCGNGNFADLAIFSFHPVKHIASGEGGMITTNDKALYNKLQFLRTHGITKDPNNFKHPVSTALGRAENQEPRAKNQDQQTRKAQQATHNHEPQTTNQPTSQPQPEPEPQNYPGWYMELQDLGYNYRLSELHAALGLSQLQRASENLQKRQQIAQKYDEAFRDIPEIRTQQFTPKGERSTVSSEQSTAYGSPLTGHGYHLYVIETENRESLFNHLRKNNILVQVHYIPCHWMPYYQELGWKVGDMPQAENCYKSCLSLPMYHGLTEEEQNFVIEKVKEWVGNNNS